MSLRIAIISAPRAGNTWVHHMLMDAYGIPGYAVHNPDDLDWAGLPTDCSVQIHWHRTPSFVRALADARFRVVTLVRHPLDTLISVLQFCQNDSSTLRWLEGEYGDERPIYGAMPCSAAFRAYATGARAAVLLEVGREWWADAGGGVRYEDLVADPAGGLERLTAALGAQPRRPVAEVIDRTTLPRMRERVGSNHHFWQGRPGLWKLLLTAPVADEVAGVHRAYCKEFAYACDPDPELTPAQADANWVACLAWQIEVRRRQQRAQAGFLKQSEARCAHLEQVRGQLELERGQLEARLSEAVRRLQSAEQELQRYQRLGGWAPAQVTRRLEALARRFPGAAAVAKRILLPRRAA